MILFFDRSVGITIPQILQTLGLLFPEQIEYHQQYFAMDEEDDSWLPRVGSLGWIVVGHDIYLKRESEIAALKQYGIGCFRLPGAEEKRWRKLFYFLRAYEEIVEKAQNTPRPFIYEISPTSGRFQSVPIPE